MNTCAIVTEYNPMHLGHIHQLNEAKSVTGSDRTLLVMSGNYVQRGEPALIDKYARTRAALQAGVDLVLELPTYFATSSAEFFAHHAIQILDATGIVTHLNYGSESGSIEGLEAIADILFQEPNAYRLLLNKALSQGHSFPKAREMALLQYNNHHKLFDAKTIELLKTPNNILGIEYIKALKRLDSNIQPTTIKRIGSTYHDDNSQVAIPSATAIRQHLYDGNALETLRAKLPQASYKALLDTRENHCGPIYCDDLFPQLKYRLLSTPKSDFSKYQDVTEGLDNRIYNIALHANNYRELLDGVVSKRYTKTKIARALLHLYLGHTKESFQRFHKDMNPYLRVLGFTASGQKMLKEIKLANEFLPIIVNVRQGYKLLDDLQRECFMADLNSSLLYNHLVHTKYKIPSKNDYQQQVIMV